MWMYIITLLQQVHLKRSLALITPINQTIPRLPTMVTILRGMLKCQLYIFQANEQSRRFEGILRTCKSVNPKMDVHNFIVCVSQESITYEPKEYIFDLPSDPNIPGSEVCISAQPIIYTIYKCQIRSIATFTLTRYLFLGEKYDCVPGSLVFYACLAKRVLRPLYASGSLNDLILLNRSEIYLKIFDLVENAQVVNDITLFLL